ncbi:MAG TPA: FtsX-like permease family protein [Candidatus Angelobacter sp.]|nr:FtsX-like permease family protein [Candidatus Angelobacter sp.]
MNRRRLFFHLLLKDIWVRRDRTLTALLSVIVVATMATVSLTVYYDLELRLSREFRSFGANVIVTKHDASLTSGDLSQINSVLGGKGEVVPVAYAIAATSANSRVVIAGANLSALRRLNSWWSIQDASASAHTALVGARAAELVSPSAGEFSLKYGAKTVSAHSDAVFHSGSDDDSRVYLDIADFTALTGVQPGTALLRIDGSPREIQRSIGQLRASLPSAEVEPVRQITQTQTAVLNRTRSVVLAASAVVVVLIMLCMVATFTSSVLERRRDFAVMKALGASNRTVNLLFASQSTLLALAGALIGFLAGAVVAYWIGRANFDAAILPRLILLVPVTLGSVVLALIAAMSPIRMLQRIEPARILRGE